MATFQERINQFRQGLDTQQNHFNDAMGMASDYGRQVLEDKLGQHYENIEKVGGTVMSAGLALGSAKNTFKAVSAKYRAMKSGKPQSKAPTERKADIQMTEPQFEPAERDGEKQAPAPKLAEGQANIDPLEEVKNTVEERVARGEPAGAEQEVSSSGIPGVEFPKEPSPLDRLSGLAKDADDLPIQGFKEAPPLPPSRQTAQPVETAEPSFEDQMASLRSQVQSIGKQSASMTPADTEALNQRTAQQLQSLGGRKLGGAGTNDPQLLQESELGQRTAYTGSRGFTPREAPPLPPSRQPATGGDDSGTLADIQNLSDLPAREIAGGSRVIRAGGFNPANAKPNTGSGTAVKGTATGTGTAEQMSANTSQLASQVEQRAGEGLAAGKSLLSGVAEGGGAVVAQALGGSKNVGERDVGAVAGGGLAGKSIVSAGKKLGQKAGVLGEDAVSAGGEAPTTAVGQLADRGGQALLDGAGALKQGASNVVRGGLGALGVEEGSIDSIMAVGGVAAEAVPVLGDLVGAGMLIYGLVKDFKHAKSYTPQTSAPTLEATEQAGGIDTQALGGSKNTGGGIV